MILRVSDADLFHVKKGWIQIYRTMDDTIAYGNNIFPRTMVSLHLKSNGLPNLLINQQLCNTNGAVYTNQDGILLNAKGFGDLLI